MDNNDLLKDVFSDLLDTRSTEQPPVSDTQVPTNLDPALFSSSAVNEPSTGTPVVKNEVQPEVLDPLNVDAPVVDDSSWDSYVENTGKPEVVVENNVNWGELGKSIGITSEIKNSNELQSYIKGLQKEIAESKTAPKLEEFPEDLRNALEIAKNQGDYLAYLEIGQIDYTVFDPVDLFEKEVEEFFENPDGTFREKEYNDYIDSLDINDKKIRGTQLQKQLIAEQTHQKQALRNKAEQDKVENLRRLERSVNTFEKIGDYVATPKVKQQVYQDLASGKFLDKLGINMNGSHNWDVLKEMYSKAIYFDAIQKFNSDRVKNQTLRQEISKVGNHNLNTTPQLGNATETRKMEGVDLYFTGKNNRR